MKKVQLLTVAMLTAVIGYQTLPAKAAARSFEMSKDVENKSTPKMRLLEQAIELRTKEKKDDDYSLHDFHKDMDKLLIQFKEDIKNAGRKFTEEDQNFFHFCKHASVKKLQARMENFKN
jgi:hypothetical protein